MKRSIQILGIALLLTAGLMTGCGGDEPVPVDEALPETAGELPVEELLVEELPADEEVDQPLGHRKVRLYFPSASSGKLVSESRDIFDSPSPGDRAKQILSDLLEGPRSGGAMRALPRGVRLRQVYVTDGGVAFADFSADLKLAIGGGSMDEVLTVYSIVNSLALNINEIRKVGILVDGEECETLSGHMDLRRPLPANRRLMR
jgi:spore germination protein GerM